MRTTRIGAIAALAITGPGLLLTVGVAGADDAVGAALPALELAADATTTPIVGQQSGLTALLTGDTGAPVVGAPVTFTATSGGDVVASGTALTGPTGRATFSYTSNVARTDTVVATAATPPSATTTTTAEETTTSTVATTTTTTGGSLIIQPIDPCITSVRLPGCPGYDPCFLVYAPNCPNYFNPYDLDNFGLNNLTAQSIVPLLPSAPVTITWRQADLPVVDEDLGPRVVDLDLQRDIRGYRRREKRFLVDLQGTVARDRTVALQRRTRRATRRRAERFGTVGAVRLDGAGDGIVRTRVTPRRNDVYRVVDTATGEVLFRYTILSDAHRR